MILNTENEYVYDNGLEFFEKGVLKTNGFLSLKYEPLKPSHLQKLLENLKKLS